MVKVDEKERIRRAYFLQRKSMRQIARELHHARRTVRKAIYDPAPPRYTRVVPAAKPVLGPFTAIIGRWLDEDLSSPKKQRHTARRIYHRLVEEHCFEGGESTVRRYVREHRPREREVYVPLEYDPGSDAQCDFGPAYVVMGNKMEQVQLFCLRLCYSTRPFVMAFPHQKQEALFEGHVAAFEFLGGIPGNIWYDQLSPAVKHLAKGKGTQEQEAFIAFRSHYLFQSRYCNPGQAHEKGLVENLVGYARRNFLVPLPKVSSFQELNDLLLERCLKEDRRRLRGKTRSIGELWREEKARLLSLPQHPYPCCKVCTVKPNSLSLVQFQSNRYSVPVTVAEDKLTLKAFVDRVEISAREKIVAVHRRCYGRHEDVLDPLHYLPLLQERIRAFPYAKPIRHWHWPEVFDRYLAALRERHQNGAATREFIRALELCSSYPEEEVARAMDQALAWHASSLDVLIRILQSSRDPELVPIPLGGERSMRASTTPCPRVEDRGLAHYSQLLGRV
jgi:transposase